MTYFNNLGQARVGWRIPSGGVTPSSLWTSVYSVYNADAVGSSSLKTSLFAAYNGESNANDSFGSNNGTAQGGLTYGVGKVGTAFEFNGTTSYVSIPNTSNQFNFTGDFSVSAWINVPNYTGTKYILSNYAPGGTGGYGFLIYHDANIFGCTLRNGTTISQYHTSAGITTNSWNHVVVVRKVGQNTKIYLNGTLMSGSYPLGNSSIVPTFTGGQIVNIGSVSNGSNLANYKQDATTIWNKELTQSEITELYNSGNGAQYITDSFYKPTTNDALNTYNGTAQGGLTYGVGKVGTAFQFNGTNAYVSIPNTSNQFNFTGDFSISTWVYYDSTPTNNTFNIFFSNYKFGGTNGSGILLYVGKGGDGISWLNFEMIALGSGALNTVLNQYRIGFIPNGGFWYHIVATRKRSTSSKLYINGTLQNGSYPFTNQTLDQTYQTDQTYNIGGVYNGQLLSSMKLDTTSVWNRELTQSEVTELYNSGNGKQYPN